MFTIAQREKATCFCLELLRNAFGRPVVHRPIEKPRQADYGTLVACHRINARVVACLRIPRDNHINPENGIMNSRNIQGRRDIGAAYRRFSGGGIDKRNQSIWKCIEVCDREIRRSVPCWAVCQNGHILFPVENRVLLRDETPGKIPIAVIVLLNPIQVRH